MVERPLEEPGRGGGERAARAGPARLRVSQLSTGGERTVAARGKLLPHARSGASESAVGAGGPITGGRAAGDRPAGTRRARGRARLSRSGERRVGEEGR